MKILSQTISKVFVFDTQSYQEIYMHIKLVKSRVLIRKKQSWFYSGQYLNKIVHLNHYVIIELRLECPMNHFVYFTVQ